MTRMADEITDEFVRRCRHEGFTDEVREWFDREVGELTKPREDVMVRERLLGEAVVALRFLNAFLLGQNELFKEQVKEAKAERRR